MIMDTRQKEWEKLQYFDPAQKLPELYIFQKSVESSPLFERHREMRTGAFKRFREELVAHLFCYGMGLLRKKTIYISLYEDSDYDAVSMWSDGEEQCFEPIQIKEVVPHTLNPLTSLEQEILKLKKYPVSHDIIVVIHLNRSVHPELSDIQVPNLNISQLWLLGTVTEDKKIWYLRGDLLNNPSYFEFEHPVTISSHTDDNAL